MLWPYPRGMRLGLNVREHLIHGLNCPKQVYVRTYTLCCLIARERKRKREREREKESGKTLVWIKNYKNVISAS